MAEYQPSSNFTNAAAYLSSGSSLSSVSTTIKLELYGLYKAVTVSPKPTSSRPSFFDMTGRAKWDSWKEVGEKFPRAQDAEMRYIEIAKSLGWSEGFETVPKAQSSSTDVDDIWDDDSQSHSSGGGGGSGMGPSVSTMVKPDISSDKSLHGLAIDNDVNGLERLLSGNPEIDLNQVDEFGYTPLHLACDRGHVDIVKLLLTKGADRSVKDQDDLTPLELAQEANHLEIANLLITA